MVDRFLGVDDVPDIAVSVRTTTNQPTLEYRDNQHPVGIELGLGLILGQIGTGTGAELSNKLK